MFFDEEMLQLEFDTLVEDFQEFTNTLRTGRPNIDAIGKIKVDYYGAPTALQAMASISADALTATIKLFDKSSDAIKSTEKALSESTVISGNIAQSEPGTFKINFPPLTEETRRQTVKELNERLEKSFKQKAKDLRHEEREKLKKLDKVPEDEVKRDEERIQKMLDECIKKLEEVAQKKEIDIMNI